MNLHHYDLVIFNMVSKWYYCVVNHNNYEDKEFVSVCHEENFTEETKNVFQNLHNKNKELKKTLYVQMFYNSMFKSCDFDCVLFFAHLSFKSGTNFINFHFFILNMFHPWLKLDKLISTTIVLTLQTVIQRQFLSFSLQRPHHDFLSSFFAFDLGGTFTDSVETNAIVPLLSAVS